MWNTPSKRRLSQIPALYSTEHQALPEKLIYLHFFLAGCDWYVCEFDGFDTFFGFVILNGDFLNAEWGYFTHHKLDRLNVRGCDVDYDKFWEPCPAAQVDKISKAQGWIKEAV